MEKYIFQRFCMYIHYEEAAVSVADTNKMVYYKNSNIIHHVINLKI